MQGDSTGLLIHHQLSLHDIMHC